MTIRVDSNQLIAGKTVVSLYSGSGIQAQNIPSTGTSGAGYLYNDISSQSAQPTDEMRGEILTWPSAGTLTVYEDSSFSFLGAPDGVYTATYRGFRNGVTYGDYTITLNVGASTANITIQKTSIPVNGKQLSLVVGTNVSFTGVLNKTSYSLSGKQLSNSLGWNSGVSKQSLVVNGKQEAAVAGMVELLQKFNVLLNSKPLSVQVGTAIPFIGLLNKLQLNAVGKPLSVSTGTSIPFLGLIDKTSLLLSGKALDAIRGQYIEIVPSHLPLITKLLSIGEVVYPVIPKRRVYGLNDKIRLYIMRR